MTAPGSGAEPRQRRSATHGGGAPDTVSLTMSYDEADAFTVYLATAARAWKAQCEQNHSDLLVALQIRALRNKSRQIREQLPDGYGDADLFKDL